jgi:MFS family permease
LFSISSLWMFAVVTPTPDFLGAMLLPWVLGGVGVGFAMPFLVAAATASLAPEQAATGSGVASMARQLGLVLGTSILVGILGTGTVAEFHQVWWVMTLASLAAGAAALAIEPIRRQAVDVITP